MSSIDAGVYAAAGLAVVLVGIAANYIPARRAARVNPMAAPRVE